MINYSLLSEIDSSILNGIFESKDFDENEKIIFNQTYSFREIYENILNLKDKKNLDFWKHEHSDELVKSLKSLFVTFYYSKHIKAEREKYWLLMKNKELLEYSFTHHFDYNFMKENEKAISRIFKKKWVVYKYFNDYEDGSLWLLEEYPNLRHLEMHVISFKDFPMLPKLVSLDVTTNDYLTSFEGLPSLPNLTSLYLIGNRFHSFHHFPELPALEELYLDYNRLTSFEGLPILPKLKTLIISDNEINSFLGFPNLPNLEVLNAASNHITSFKDLPILSKLKKLYVNDNDLDSFEDFPDFPELVTLDIAYNQFTSFEGMPNLMKLEKLLIHHNSIEYLDHLPDLPNLALSTRQELLSQDDECNSDSD